jgi:hypothetical protein
MSLDRLGTPGLVENRDHVGVNRLPSRLLSLNSYEYVE